MIRVKLTSGAIPGILFGLMITAAANADAPPGPGFERAGRAEILREIKAIESESHRERIRILQAAETCIQQARAFREYRECEWAEQQAREELQDRLRPKRKALRDRIRSVQN
jgi:hypothetical protein